MKKLVFIALVIVMVLGIALRCPAPIFRQLNNQYYYVFTNVFVVPLSATANATNFTQGTSESSYHTFHIFYTGISGTNGGATCLLQHTLDGTNFVNATNFVVLSGTPTTNWEYVFNGKFSAMQFVTTDLATNGTLTVNYMGQSQ